MTMSNQLRKYFMPRDISILSAEDVPRLVKKGEYIYLAADVKAVLKDVTDTLTNLQEYWNGNHNERAMADALEHLDREATRLLALLQEPVGKPDKFKGLSPCGHFHCDGDHV